MSWVKGDESEEDYRGCQQRPRGIVCAHIISPHNKEPPLPFLRASYLSSSITSSSPLPLLLSISVEAFLQPPEQRTEKCKSCIPPAPSFGSEMIPMSITHSRRACTCIHRAEEGLLEKWQLQRENVVTSECCPLTTRCSQPLEPRIHYAC